MINRVRMVRTRLGLSQAELAAGLDVSVDSLRVWDSGRRPAPAEIFEAIEALVEDPSEQALPLRVLAERFDVHVRTLRAAARDGRLDASYANRSIFGRPIPTATGRAVAVFMEQGFGKSAAQLRAVPALVSVPPDCAARIVSQAELARRVGAANKAVVYQWETGKRRPSEVFWTRLTKLQNTRSQR